MGDPVSVRSALGLEAARRPLLGGLRPLVGADTLTSSLHVRSQPIVMRVGFFGVISLANIGWCCSTVPIGSASEIVFSPVDRDVAELTRLVATGFEVDLGVSATEEEQISVAYGNRLFLRRSPNRPEMSVSR